ncbi:MAG TPA: cyclic nucleotide-binding domain-containing protein [Myxococcota bacterium]|nr:cyclic nucleotide-binding domain-containing protein [Myxococcota bacterium]
MSADALKGFVPFADLSEGERAEIAELLEERSLSPGETLFVEGDDADALVLVTEGTVQVESRRTRESANLGPGTVLGGLALFAVGARETSAAGAERAEVLLLRREDFLRLAEDSPRTAWRVAMALSAELAAALRGALGSLPAVSVDPIQPAE